MTELDLIRAIIRRWRDATKEWDVAKFGGFGYDDTARRNRAAGGTG